MFCHAKASYLSARGTYTFLSCHILYEQMKHISKIRCRYYAKSPTAKPTAQDAYAHEFTLCLQNQPQAIDMVYIYIYIYKLVSFPDPSLYIVPILFHKFMVEVIQYWR